jgi:hypothetical protein
VRLLAGAVAVAVAISLVATWTAVASRTAPSKPKDSGIHLAAAGHCVDSFDPSCGPLRWDPAPGANAPVTTRLTPSSPNGIAGRGIAIDARATDPDARIACHWILFGDEQTALIPSITMQRQYGRWITPAKRAGSFGTTYTHTYTKPGIYHVQFGARSGDGCSNDYNPYGGESVATATVTIAAP